MWYNRIVMDENNNEILREKCFVSEVYELYNGLGMDFVMVISTPIASFTFAAKSSG